MRIPYEFNCTVLDDIHHLNSTFAEGSLKVMYLGENRNGSYFSKESVERALPSLKNVPIVCHWDDEAEEIGGHDVALVSNSEGELRLKNLTEPCGVVPEHAQFEFQKESADDGSEHEYLVIKGVILWKRQDVFKHIQDDLGGKVKHSMEIGVKNSREINGYMDITDFEFTALCLLENVEPCFQGSELELYSADGMSEAAEEFRRKMDQMMLELKELYSVNPPVHGDNDKHPQELSNFSTEGGKVELDEKLELLARLGVDVDNLDFSIDDMSLEDIEARFASQNQNDGAGTGDDEPDQPDNFALNSNIIEEIERTLSGVTIQREWGECCRYWFVDCDLELGEVYCWDKNDWLLYGFAYTVNGDAIVIDWDSKKRMKYAIVAFDEGDTQESPFEAAFADMESRLGEYADTSAKYQAAVASLEELSAEVEELRKFKADIETSEAENARNEVLNRFEDLRGVDAFDALCEQASNYSVEDLEEKCYAIKGRLSASAKFSFEGKSPKLIVEKTDLSGGNEPYGGLFVKYGTDA